ncbi:MAG: ornithine carbamoyltransferase [Candidatus Altiarchaeales archaeon ex4484_96]|nr:MAG: ornithine carbamoyltransferase [Candidatus Altiarchaeales archaeon ex4484_96]
MHLLSMTDLGDAELSNILTETERIKKNPIVSRDALVDKSLVLLFEKPSTRTKVSFEVAMFQLGGQSINLNVGSSQLSRGESIGDSARVLSRYANAIAARVYNHKSLLELAEYSTVPVINALSDLEHPCQVISDLYTIRESRGRLKGVKLAYVGDGNNVCNSLILGCAMTGVDLSIASPLGYAPDEKLLLKAQSMASSEIKKYTNPVDAVTGADYIYTDVWVGMGDESEKKKRLKAFQDYQVNESLLEKAADGCRIMHCLPAHRGMEITDEVLDGPQSIVWEQAENRLHTQKAILLKLLQ